jgi:hypothetical protein
MARDTYNTSKLNKTCEIAGMPGKFYLIRKAKSNSRVIAMDNLNGPGFLVATDKLIKVEEIEPALPPVTSTTAPAIVTPPVEPVAAVESSQVPPVVEAEAVPSLADQDAELESMMAEEQAAAPQEATV